MDQVVIRRMQSNEGVYLEYVACAAFQNNPMLETIYQTTGKELFNILKKDVFEGMFTQAPHETYVAELDGRFIGFIRSGTCTGSWHSWHSCSNEEYQEIVKQRIMDLSIEKRWKWLEKTCETYDLGFSHSHVGPVAVLPMFQSKGIGTKLLMDYFSRLGDSVSFLETFQEVNARFYMKCGYSLFATDSVLGQKGYWLKKP